MICHSTFGSRSTFPANRPRLLHHQSVHPRPQLNALLHGQARRWRCATAVGGRGSPRRRNGGPRMMSFWSPAQDVAAGIVFVHPEVLLLATTPTTFSCRRKPLELLLQVRSLLSPSCIFAEVCIYFPVECVGSTIFMDGFFSLNKKLLCA
jgi:hypothetical protein